MITKETEKIIKDLQYLVRSYEGIVKLNAGLKNRLRATNPDADPNTEDGIHDIHLVAGKFARRIEKALEPFDIWTHWLKGVPGIGPTTAGKLVIFYYYRFVPICEKCGGNLEKFEKVNEKTGKTFNVFKCKDCEKEAKGEGVTKHRIEEKDFANVSKWWAYMGCAVKDGKLSHRAKGVVSNYPTKGKVLGFHVGEAFNRQTDKTPYGQYLLAMKAKHLKKNDDCPYLGREEPWTKGHIHNAGCREAAKLFLSHFWHVARSLAGKSTEGPYVEVIKGHTGIIPPYHWDADVEIAT